MIEEIKEQIALHKGSGKTFAEFIAELFKDKFIEIYLGDAYEEVKTEQTSEASPAFFYGKVIGAYKECLIINCAHIKGGKIQLGKLLFINERAIRALSIINGETTINDIILNGSDSKLIKKIFEDTVKNEL